MNKRVSEMTPEELAKYRARARERRRLMIERMTPEELAKFNAYNSARHKRYLESMPPEKRKEMKKKVECCKKAQNRQYVARGTGGNEKQPLEREMALLESYTRTKRGSQDEHK